MGLKNELENVHGQMLRVVYPQSVDGFSRQTANSKPEGLVFLALLRLGTR